MIIKKYLVKDMNEAMNKIKNDLGIDAVIISSRKIRKPGIGGLLSKKVIEVTAAVDNSEKENNDYGKIQNSTKEDSITALKKAMEKHSERTKNHEQKMALETSKPSDFQNAKEEKLLNEMQEMKNLINGFVKKSSEEESSVMLKLKKSDMNEEVIKELLTELQDGTEEDLKNIVQKHIKLSEPKESGIMVLVGPTGVGKTTTIAKLAGKFSLMEKKKVGLITVDTYRIGAVEQLRTYADIMNIPFSVVLTIKEMDQAINSMKDCDIILVDTTGRSSKNEMQISELRAFIERTHSQNIHLVLSCTTKDNDIRAIVNGYKKINFQNIIITKLDETTTYGSVVNILKYTSKPISYFTTGQNVPDDIKMLTVEEISSLILGEDTVC